jgi:hypothetical protein
MIGNKVGLDHARNACLKLNKLIDKQKVPVQVLKTQVQYNKSFGYYVEALTELENFQDVKDRTPVMLNDVLVVISVFEKGTL